jgi:UDP-N-acetylmuramate dehydrogenase
MKDKIFIKFCGIVGSDYVKIDEPMKHHTTLRIGGPADYYICPHTAGELQEILHICKQNKIPYFILGNGSNLLVSDKGYRGAIIHIYRNMNHIRVDGNVLTVQAGTLFSQVSKKAMEHGLTGLEFAAGIPGTMGGAVVMNAGAYGGEIRDVLKEVVVLDQEGEIRFMKGADMQLGYRTSIIKEAGYIVLEAVLELQSGDKEAISGRMEELKKERIAKQPLEYPSAGSTFKRPEGYFAGKLIMDAGLKGFRVGGAQISEKHCGFVINVGDATAKDVLELIRQVQEKVKVSSGVWLELELKVI